MHQSSTSGSKQYPCLHTLNSPQALSVLIAPGHYLSSSYYMAIHGIEKSVNNFLLQLNKAADKEQMKTVIDNYQDVLRTRTNPKNLKNFVEAFLK